MIHERTTRSDSKNRGRTRFAAAALSLIAAACAGGSGSSGFITESAAISSAVSQQQCVDYQGVKICPIQGGNPTPAPTPPPTAGPSGTPDPFATPTAAATASPTPTTDPRSDAAVFFDVPLDEARGCEIETDAMACSLPVLFNTRGFPSGTAFYVAIRQDPQGGPWNLIQAGTASGPASISVTVPIDVSGSMPGGSPSNGSIAVQIAVLVYFTPPSSVTTPVTELIDAGPDEVYVSGTVAVSAD